MNLAAGIVGLPNVGKSTLFNALLKRQVALAANYPFATIEPNTGIVPVPDPRLKELARIVNTSVIKPATVEFVDIAGLVRGASKGEGLGNQFLSHIREVDLICHVIRGFSDEQVLREGSVSPLEDKETVETELLLADLTTLEKQKPPKASKEKSELERWAMTEFLLQSAQNGKLIKRAIDSAETNKKDDLNKLARELNLLTAKTVIYIINIDESELSRYDELVQKYAGELSVSPEEIILVSAKIESELSALADDDQKLYLAELGLEFSGLERLIQKAYTMLGLQSFLTAGEIEVRAWTIRTGTTAPDAAGVIHTDFTKKFIKAKVASFSDFIEYKGWKGLKESGKARFEGKEYQMRDGDVVEFMIQ